MYFFFQAEDGIRDGHVTGVQTCALPICQTAAATSVEKFPDGPQDGETYLRELQTRYAEHADNSRKHAEASAEDDPTTEDLFIEVSRAVDQALYFIEAHLNQK